MTYQIDQTVLNNAKLATVIAIDVKRGKQILTIRFEDGSERKTPAACVSPDVQFAPADVRAAARPLGDYYGDRARMSARW